MLLPEPPPPWPVATSAQWMYPVLGQVNVKISLPLVAAYHVPLTHYTIRYAHQWREVDQSHSYGTHLDLAPGIPSPGPGGTIVTYDGLDPDLKGTNGMPLLAFSLPIQPPP